MTLLDKFLNFLKDENGYISTASAKEQGVNGRVLGNLVNDNTLEKVAHGLYMSSELWPDPFYISQHRCSKIVFSHLTALYLHGFSNRDPLIYMVTAPTGSSSTLLKEDQFRFYYNSQKLINLGVEVIDSPHGNPIRVFNIERTLCDCIKYIDKLDRDLVLTGLKEYLRSDHKDSIKLMEYATALKIGDKMHQYLEVL